MEEWKRNNRTGKEERFTHFSKSEKEKGRSSCFPSKSEIGIVDLKKEKDLFNFKK